MTYLIIGGDGLIGVSLYRALRSSGADVYRTSKQPDANSKSFFFDLRYPSLGASSHSVLQSFIRKTAPTVYITAGVTGLKECEAARELTWTVNVENTFAIANELVCAGCFVVFLSSNAVFSGKRQFPNEYEKPCPITEYGRQKAEVEDRLQRLAGGSLEDSDVAIVRLTKVLPDTRGLVQNWVALLRSNACVQAMDDYIFSPISLRFVTESLIKLASRQVGGIYHLSGSQDLSYYAFAQMLARASGAGLDLVESVKRSADSTRESMEGSLYSALGMKQTLQKTGISPQSPEAVVNEMRTM